MQSGGELGSRESWLYGSRLPALGSPLSDALGSRLWLWLWLWGRGYKDMGLRVWLMAQALSGSGGSG